MYIDIHYLFNIQNLATNAYDDLVDIMYNPQFNLDHVIKNVRRF